MIYALLLDIWEEFNQIHQAYWQALKRTICDLKETKKKILELTEYDPIAVYVNSDWGTELNDRKSVSRFLIKVYGVNLTLSSKKRVTVATSSREAEYVVSIYAVSEIIWTKGIMEGLRQNIDTLMKIYEDNRYCITMAMNLEIKQTSTSLYQCQNWKWFN